jgi:hypothetical protein
MTFVESLLLGWIAGATTVGLIMVCRRLEEIRDRLGVSPVRVRMPWESDGSTFNIVKKNMSDDGMG